MRDRDIRKAFHRTRLRPWHRSNRAVVVDELALQNGSARADIVVVNGKLNGFEIKSDGDSLARLTGQVSAYNAVFDHVTIIVVTRHLRLALKLVPKWWGVTVSEHGKGGMVHFHIHRKPEQNDARDAISIAQLLWRSEAVEVLGQHGVTTQSVRMTRAVLHQQLTESLRLEELAAAVRLCLKRRAGWRDHKRPFQYGDSYQPVSRQAGFRG